MHAALATNAVAAVAAVAAAFSAQNPGPVQVADRCL